MARIGLALVVFIASITAFGPRVHATEGRLDQIAEASTVRIAYRADANPFSFLNQRNEPDGYTVDLCKLVVQSLERQVNKKLRIEWVQVTTQSRFEAIANGKADMECGSSTVSLTRMMTVDFSSFTFVENTGVMVRAGSEIYNLDRMSGKKIAVIAGTTNEAALRKELERRKLDATVVTVTDRSAGMAALTSGQVDGFASDKLLLLGAQSTEGQSLTMLPENLSTEPYAIVLPRGDWAFRLAVNRSLSEIYGSGAVLDIFLKWFSLIGARPDLLRAAVYVFGTLPE